MLKVLVKFKGKVLYVVESDKTQITIGRSEENDIVIDNLAVSKQHARILRYLDGYSIEDLNSTNGTFLNQKKKGWAKLSNKDTVTIGKHELEVYYSLEPEEKAPRDTAQDTIKIPG